MPYECKTDCQIEVSPGLFKFIIAGQTTMTVRDKKVPIRHVPPISRKYFVLTGDAVKADVQDKKKIKRALSDRNVKYQKGSSTSALAKLLAKDNRKRGVVDLASLDIVAPPRHFADQRVKDAKARVDELYGLSEHDDCPYDDETPLDTLIDMIEKKETELEDDDDQEPIDLKPKDKRDPVRAKLDALGVEYPHTLGLVKLEALLVEAEAKTDEV